MNGLSIGQLVTRTGVAEGTLRMWERRHGFPAPQRLPGGHRRYSENDVALVQRVVLERSGGMSLAAAIERVNRSPAPATLSLFATLRRRRDLEPQTLRKSLLLSLTRAIEDESLSRAERPLLFGSFQSERFYRQEQTRWGELSLGAELAVAFADFAQVGTPAGGPIEIPIEKGHPFSREWSVVCCAPGHAVCLAAWEPPVGVEPADADRAFESVWSVEPDIVWEAARVCAAVTSSREPELIEPLRSQLEADPGPPDGEQLRLAAAITNRMLTYVH